MRWRNCVYCVIFLSLNRVSGQTDCRMTGKNVSCARLIEENLLNDMVVSLSKENTDTIEVIKISDSYIFSLKRDMFRNFKNLQALYVQNALTANVDEYVFADLTNLKELYLTNNYIDKIGTSLFPINNTLITLDLSHNILSNLTDFDISAFPFLTVLNISHNKLKYLPVNIVNKLKEENNFHLQIDNNPWDCDDAEWSSHLSTILIDAFCTNNIYSLNLVEQKVKSLESGGFLQGDGNASAVICSTQCTIRHCLLWMFASFWIGIIIGNLCLIKRLLFTTPMRHEDKSTQCDKLDPLSRVSYN